MSLAGGKAAGGVTVPAGAEKVVVTITDGGGTRIRQVDLGALPAGTQRFEWDGKTRRGQCGEGRQLHDQRDRDDRRQGGRPRRR